MERRRVRALSARTEFVADYGMISFDPDSGRDELKFPLIPVGAIASLIAKGWVADNLEDSEAVEAPPEEAPASVPAPQAAPVKPARGGRQAKPEEAPASETASDDAPAA